MSGTAPSARDTKVSLIFFLESTAFEELIIRGLELDSCMKSNLIQ